MKKSTFLIFTCILLLLTACAGRGGGLEGTSWELVELMDGSQPLAGTTLTIVFEQGSAGGTAGCNSYGGEYKLDGDTIFFGDVASTLMACLDAGVMEQEAAYLGYLQEARSYQVADGFLYIYREDGAALKFKQQ